VLQFLEKSSALHIVSSMQEHTKVEWYNLIIVPIDCPEHICPIRFPGLFQQGELKELYNNWDIIKYNEFLWTFHRKDELWNKIIARFATIIAKKK
jgi:tellurite methyltransferase